MEKVKVSKEVFEAFESVKEWKLDEGDTLEGVLSEHYVSKAFCEKRIILNDLDVDFFMRCVYYGYELELTK